MVAQPKTSSAVFARLGFYDAAAAARWAADQAIAPLLRPTVAEPNRHAVPEFLTVLSFTPDPDNALRAVVRIMDTDPGRSALGEVFAGVRGTQERDALLAVLGHSVEFGEFLLAHPHMWAPAYRGVPDAAQMRAELLAAVGVTADADQASVELAEAEAMTALRVAYRGLLLAIAIADLTSADHQQQVQLVGNQLADLAAAALHAALALARAHTTGQQNCALAIIGMGKCGGRELNYISDVDVMYVVAPQAGASEAQAVAIGNELAAKVGRYCGEHLAAGSLWPVDVGLRPEGSQGPLTRTVASYAEYYRRWAKTWEFQALLKARVVAGDQHLGAELLAVTTPLVWSAAHRENFVADVRAMRRRVEQTLPQQGAARQLKLGPGGIRDVEFSVQLLQLVHGRTDVAVRHRGTLTALSALVDGGYISRSDGAELGRLYRFLRVLEHRCQLHKLKRSQVVPSDQASLRRLARALYLTDADDFEREWARTKRLVRQLHEALFYRPLLDSVSRLSTDHITLTPDSAKDRLRALGYEDAAGALGHIQALTTGVSRRAAIQRQLLPVLLEWFAQSPKPDAGLLAFRRLSDTLGRTHWYLKLLRDSGAAAERLTKVLVSGRYVAELLERDPQAIQWLGEPEALRPRPVTTLAAQARAVVDRVAPQEAIGGLRGLRRRELLRTALGAVIGENPRSDTACGLTQVTGVVLDAALEVAWTLTSDRLGLAPGDRVPITVIGMGRFGGGELSFASDVDVMFCHDVPDGYSAERAAQIAVTVVAELQKQLNRPGAEPALALDADLRPEGKQGPLSRSFASYVAYYERWSQPWEAQALLRAHAVAGDLELGSRFEQLIHPYRYPDGGLAEKDVREIRRLKARMEAERLPRGIPAKRHLKLGPGGLSDIEWLAQLWTLQGGAATASLRCTGTVAALEAAVKEGFVPAATGQELISAWSFLSQCRDAITLWLGKAGDVIPTSDQDLAGIARLLGQDVATGADLAEELMRIMRRTRRLTEPLFFGH